MVTHVAPGNGLALEGLRRPESVLESTARPVAAASWAVGIPINRSTVVASADINKVSGCSEPWPSAVREGTCRHSSRGRLVIPARVGAGSDRHRLMMFAGRLPTGHSERAATTRGLPRLRMSASKLVSTTTIMGSSVRHADQEL